MKVSLVLILSLTTTGQSLPGAVQELSHAGVVVKDASGPAFEVAIVRPANPDGKGSFGWKITPSGRFTAGSESLHNLVVLAYGGGVSSGEVLGGPEWTNSIAFDINAKVDTASMGDWEKLSSQARLERVKPMLQRLLADRFHLMLQAEQRLTPVYALVQAKGGAKLKEVSPQLPETAEEQAARARGEATTAPPGGFKRTGMTFKGDATSMVAIRGMIASVGGADRLIIDQTGLTGYYAFAFTMSLDKDGPTVLEQVQEQLGLKLEPRKVPMTTYVIESAEKPSLDGTE